ncbi:glycoside hydrolase family 36 protein [Oleiharenicola lentus]|uniref:glycoside hydrolase family 36 protein n=1 Tax=Oleiharenicola lentus TaxID=2508720 RepID=UPI003F6805BC
MPILTRAEYTVGPLWLRYLAAEDKPDAWGLSILPLNRRGDAVTPREWLDTAAIQSLPAPWNKTRAWEIDPLVHVHVAGEAYAGGFAQGRTLRNSATTQSLRVREHRRSDEGAEVVLRTVLVAGCGLECVHTLRVDASTGVMAVEITVTNASAQTLALEHMGSFSLGGITPFASDDAPGRLRVHRFRSAWSAEGRHDVQSIEALNLERSWTGHGTRSERFGQAGTLPVNGWFPLVGVEDRGAGVTWLAQLATPGAWHLEIYRKGDQLALAGGGADGLNGDWLKALLPGATFSAPTAYLTVADGNVDAACDQLLLAAKKRISATPASEAAFPVIFNEWCTSWGNPTHDSLVQLADRLAGTGVNYLVIDDGWAERPGNQFQQNGDWKVNRAAFPNGLRATTDAIRARGLVPGIWFEFEAVNPGSKAWDETDHLLHWRGVPLQVGSRRFWDFRDPWVHDFLAERVIARLRDDGFGYLKVDYNDSIGAGVDGSEAPAENVRQHLAGVQRFFARLKQELPDLVIENCSSGGHRLEASMMALTSMSSFSDAHETPDIPLIAANLNRLVPAAQKQVWAVLRKEDSRQRLSYSLAAAFLGRICLSGDVHALSAEAWQFSREAIALYREAAPILRAGIFRCFRQTGDSYAHPTGWQVVTIHAGRELVVVWHRFAQSETPAMEIALPTTDGTWRITGEMSSETSSAQCQGDGLAWSDGPAWSGGVLRLRS